MSAGEVVFLVEQTNWAGRTRRILFSSQRFRLTMTNPIGEFEFGLAIVTPLTWYFYLEHMTIHTPHFDSDDTTCLTIHDQGGGNPTGELQRLRKHRGSEI